jgi:hypothetical protein
MPNDPRTSRPGRVAFGLEIVQGNDAATSYVSVIVRGDWDMEMVEALSEFLVRTRKRLKKRGPLLLSDVWEATNEIAA